MAILTFEQLHTSLLNFLQSIEQFDFYLHDFFTNLYNTGLRYIELYEQNRWTINGDGTFECNTAKNSFDRTFQDHELSFAFKESLRSGYFLYSSCAYTTTRRYFSRFYSYPLAMVGNKKIATHIFRHHMAKSLKEQGETDSFIQAYLGEKSLTNVQDYIYSEIVIPG